MKPRRVLIIEDYASIRDVYSFGLTKAGFRCDEVKDTDGARALLKSHNYDAIVLDLLLPQENGLEFLKALDLKGANAGTKVVILSNVNHPSVVKQTEALGASGFYVKSDVTPQQLAEKLQNILDG